MPVPSSAARTARSARAVCVALIAALAAVAAPARLASQPAHVAAPRDTDKTFFTRRDALAAAGIVAVSAGVSVFDKRIANWTQSPGVQGSASRYNTAKRLTVVNEVPLTLGAFGIWGVARIVHLPTVADVSLHTGEALVLTVLTSETVRGTLGRLRPRASPDDQYDFNFGKGFTDFAARSYPSIHAAVAFTTAAALTEETRERDPSAVKFVAPVLYAAALVPGFTRMYLDQHWASDVVAGAALGQLLGFKVVHYAHTHGRTRLDRALLGTTLAPAPGGAMLAVRFAP